VKVLHHFRRSRIECGFDVHQRRRLDNMDNRMDDPP
jgi:hypothetical protein